MLHKSGILIGIALFFAVDTYSQTRLPVWSFHDDSAKIYGLSLGLTSNNKKDQAVTTGIHLELLGLGILFPLLGMSPIYDNPPANRLDKAKFSEKVYGVNISPLGTFTDDFDMYGLSLNGVSSLHRISNGLTISGVFNYSEVCKGGQIAFLGNESRNLHGLQLGLFNKVHANSFGLQAGTVNVSGSHAGIQLGIFNKTKNLKGIQLGLWNMNGRRKMPIVNW